MKEAGEDEEPRGQTTSRHGRQKLSMKILQEQHSADISGGP